MTKKPSSAGFVSKRHRILAVGIKPFGKKKRQRKRKKRIWGGGDGR